MLQRPDNRLNRQTCLVTGANSGIGLEVALSMGREGANVVVNYIVNPNDAEEVAGKVRAMKTRAVSRKM